MKRLAVIGILSSLALMAQPPGGRRGGPMGFGPGMEMRNTVTGAPYSGVELTVEQQALSGGNVIQRQTTRNVYRDGQGRVRVESDVPAAAAAATPTAKVRRVMISDPVAGYVHQVDPQNKTVTSRAVRQAGTQAMMRPRGTAMQRPARAADATALTEDLGTQTVNGVIATGTRVTHTIPAGTIGNALPIQSVRETWVSADLKVPVQVKVTDPRFGTRTTQLTQINRGEPDAALFQVPTGYTVSTATGGRGPRGVGGPRNQ